MKSDWKNVFILPQKHVSGCTLLHTGFSIQTIEMCSDTKNHPVGRPDRKPLAQFFASKTKKYFYF
jgi:hypothetical protein